MPLPHLWYKQHPTRAIARPPSKDATMLTASSTERIEKRAPILFFGISIVFTFQPY